MEKATVYLKPDLDAGYWRAKIVRFPIAVGDSSRKEIIIAPSPERALWRAFEFASEFWGSPEITVIMEDRVQDPATVEMALRQAHGDDWAGRLSWNHELLIVMISTVGWEIDEGCECDHGSAFHNEGCEFYTAPEEHHRMVGS